MATVALCCVSVAVAVRDGLGVTRGHIRPPLPLSNQLRRPDREVMLLCGQGCALPVRFVLRTHALRAVRESNKDKSCGKDGKVNFLFLSHFVIEKEKKKSSDFCRRCTPTQVRQTGNSLASRFNFIW